MITQDSIDTIRGATVYDNDGDKIGKVGEVYLDDSTGQPAWMTVTTGLFGTAQSFVPLQEASLSGEDVRVPYTKATIKDAPRVDADGHLDVAEEDALYDYYGVGGVSSGTTGETTGAAFADDDRGDRFEADRVEGNRVEGNRVETGTPDMTGETRGEYREGRESREGLGMSRSTSAPTTDDAMTRSEEQLHVGTEAREASRARLRKYVVTERQSVTVPVSHDEVRLEREPVTGGNVTTDQQVSDDVREERVAMEGEGVNDPTLGQRVRGSGDLPR